jgi:hypothetical protein
LWLFLLFFIIAMITFSFIMSLFFKKAKVSVIAAILIYMLVNTPFFFVWEEHDYDFWKSFNPASLFFSCFFPSLAIDIGSAVIVSLEFKGVGLTWSSLRGVESPAGPREITVHGPPSHS